MDKTRLNVPRRIVLAAALFAAALLAVPASADQAAEAFVASILDEANLVFQNPDKEARKESIEDLVDKYVDMRRVGLFALGQYARVITDEQKAAYLPLFRKYATTIYHDLLEDYSGQRLAVTGSIDRTARDIIVNSQAVDARPGDPLAGVVIHWRVYRDREGRQAIVDAGADGVWLAIEQQSQFKSVIANNGGGTTGIDALIAELRKQTGG
ncbi:MlaC/ttg2D family ABC transporter substrate-binding protein [Amphiplicatus metriothermophilus]|uniref:ABC-type transporter Mla maintaining outer membrane lipid asymmetry, MlaC component n=1 Tax=Amphiplicatus metriothermophilus TaxID=1519374 RepID=A0A239Q084_9PROT|nr:ABC transporter substrate-binding protein [Amphiplicatus metriothermophilus]MBB5520160.1 phospholipid transport system substrate-binding protein [Amphiplicatus metriothermophilus]SNT75748.1 ABC-type transporter Mla maintaining outer membrane lipid asymmetry, MlaC component [Amphiplicatus metriothermophilus]